MSNYKSENNFLKDYVDVAQRIIQFREKYPNGSLQPFNKEQPITIINIGDKTYLQYIAVAYRTPDDQAPGVGVAWELFPGRTPFTRDSEAMVAETSAWGRAIIASLAADTKKGIASKEEVLAAKSRQVEKIDTPEFSEYDPIEVIKITPEQIKQIHILRNQIENIKDDEKYREYLKKQFNVTSSTELTKNQANKVLTEMRKFLGKANG